jgi:hypothetical protein
LRPSPGSLASTVRGAPLLWISYGIAARNLALIVPNTVALLIGASTVAIAVRLR